MITLHAMNIALHVAAGTLALTLGLVPLLSTKGGPVHRFVGWLFVAAGAVVLVCAAISVVLFAQPGPLIIATVAASYEFVGGLRALPRFRATPNFLDAFLAIVALALCGTFMIAMGRGNVSWPPVTGYTILGFLAMIAVYDLSRHAWPRRWRRSVRPIDHGLKMTAAYFAMASAGLGNLAPQWKPWSQFSPSVLGALVSILFLVLYIRGRRRGARHRSLPETVDANFA